MRQKQLSQPTRASELAGAQLEISGIHNDDLRESATIVNLGPPAHGCAGGRWLPYGVDRFIVPG